MDERVNIIMLVFSYLIKNVKICKLNIHIMYIEYIYIYKVYIR